MSSVLPILPMSGSQADVVASFLREQRDLLQELICDVESNFMSHVTSYDRISQIESNLKKLKSAI